MSVDQSPTISARSFEGLSAHTADGRPARFALVDEDGQIIACGKDVADKAFHTSVEAYRKFLLDEGHMRVFTKAEAMAIAAR